MTAAQEPRAGEVLVWTQRGAGVDGDPLRATATLGDMTAEVLLSRGTGLWNARGSHIDGRLGLATQSEARDYAEVAMRVRAKERVAAARACLDAFVSRPSESSASGGDAWQCFHCDEAFTDRRCAALHFGANEDAEPACKIKGSEGGLIEALRRAEKDAGDAWFMIHNEATDAAKAYYAQNTRHREQAIALEQAGYDRGIADAIAHPESLGLAALRTQAPAREGEGSDQALVAYLRKEAAKNKVSRGQVSAGAHFVTRARKLNRAADRIEALSRQHQEGEGRE